MKRILSILILIIPSLLSAQNDSNQARWIRYPAISPDGQEIVFGYMGNLYKVNSTGGVAIPITMGDSYNKRPVWSHDGKTIAYASDRYGNFDIFTMPSSGGKSTRLTFNSADDIPYDFDRSNQNVLFGSFREAPYTSVRFPGIRYFQNIYTIAASGGRPILLSAAGMEEARYDSSGNQIVFQDKKGYEDPYRKHQISSIARDIWIYNVATNSYNQITHTEVEDRNPVFSNDNNHIYYTSEKNGELNIYKKSLAQDLTVQLTDFKNFPVRSLTISQSGTLCFTWQGDLYTLTEGQTPQKVIVIVNNNGGYNTVKNVDVNKITEFAVNPNGKEIAYIIRGEVFVTSTSINQTKRITNTPEQERMLNWSPDGKTLLFSSERNNSWNIYKATLEHPEEKFFYGSTTLKIDSVIASDKEEYQPKFSPDGQKVAFVEERNILKVLDLKSGNQTTILPQGHNYSYSDGDWSFEWSPDSKWLLVDDQKGYFASSNTALISADGKGEIVYPVNSGFGESNAKWSIEGKAMTYESGKLGRKSIAYQGSMESDVYAVFFDQKAYDEFTLSKEDYDILKARKEADKNKDDQDSTVNEQSKEKGKSKSKDKSKDKTDIKPLQLDLNNLSDRIVRLTINSASISDYTLTKEGSKLYYLTQFEKGYDLWETEPRTRKTKILTKLSGSASKIILSDDEKYIFLSNSGKLSKIETATGKIEAIPIQAEMEIDHQAERKYIYNHAWNQVVKKFYDPKLLGAKWEMYRDSYATFLPYINNNYDFQVLLSELLGELNASHTGGRYYPTHQHADQTGALGLLYDETYTGNGILIKEIIQEGPADNAANEIQPNDLIVKINGQAILAKDNWNQLLNNTVGKNILLTIQHQGKTFEQTIKPITLAEQNNLMYKRWIHTMEKLTDSLSGGQLGYVHIRGMNDNSFREVIDNVLGRNIGKKGLVVDTRFNGGGWLHNDLNTFLSGKQYLQFAPQSNLTKGGEPIDRWTKPSIVVMSEGNYSDAFIFPYIYKQNKLGKLVGMPVPGTGTAVWWERQIDPTIVFGIPMVATIGIDGKPTENLQLEPDIKMPLPYDKFLNGEDTQLEAAIKELLKEVK